MDTQQDQHELQVQQKREVESKQEATVPARVFLPQTDIFETEQALTVILEMPGVDKDKVDVKVENDVLQIEGWINFSRYEGLQPVYTEYNIGNYARSFQLSSKIDQDRITAELRDGVMKLVLPKSEKAKPRKIAVS
jgi:HSP20 family molecular chaperone IbpA